MYWMFVVVTPYHFDNVNITKLCVRSRYNEQYILKLWAIDIILNFHLFIFELCLHLDNTEKNCYLTSKDTLFWLIFWCLWLFPYNTNCFFLFLTTHFRLFKRLVSFTYLSSPFSPVASTIMLFSWLQFLFFWMELFSISLPKISLFQDTFWYNY